MLIKNGKKYYCEDDLKAYAYGYWAGRFDGYADTRGHSYAYQLGFQHGEADYLEYDADFTPDPAFDDLDVVEQIKNHPQEPTQTC